LNKRAADSNRGTYRAASGAAPGQENVRTANEGISCAKVPRTAPAN